MSDRLKYIKEVSYLLGENRRRLPLLIFLFLSSSILDLAGISLIAPYIALIVNPEDSIQSDISSFFSAWGLTFQQGEVLLYLGISLVIIFLLKSVSAIWINKKILYFCYQQGVRLRSFLMKSYQELPYIEYLQRNSAEYIYSMEVLTNQYSQVTLQCFIRIISEGIVVIAIVSLLAWYNPQALALLVLLLGFMMITYDKLFRNKVQEYGRSANEHSTYMLKGIQEGLSGFKELRILGKESYFHKMVDKGAKGYAKASVHSTVIATAPRYLLEFLLITFVVLLVIWSLMMEGGTEKLLPTLSMFGVASMRLAPSAYQIINSITHIRYGRHSTGLLYLDTKNSKEDIELESDDSAESGSSPFHSIEFSGVGFSYLNTETTAIDNVTLKINAGESIGLIGASGSGKTTMVDLLLGLLVPQTGKILYNDKPLKECLLDWTSKIAYLPQQVFLVDDTLRNNIALGLNEKEIDESKIIESINQARLMDLVDQLPKGVNTILGERGARLSGGQRQRVAIARAFYHGRDVLIMDEATSALDHETELEITEEIKRFKGKKTMIIIAHRLTTVQHCDKIYKFERGNIIASGAPQDILKTDKH